MPLIGSILLATLAVSSISLVGILFAGVFSYVLAGILVFFFVEKFLKWRHSHAGHCDAHSFTQVSLIGDGVHNFIDGMVIAASFAGLGEKLDAELLPVFPIWR